MRLLAIASSVLLVAAAVAMALERRSERASTGAVTVLGDSLNVGMEPYLAARLPGWTIDNHNRVGRRSDEGVRELRTIADLAPVLVVSLGTNDIPGDGEGFRQQVEEVLRIAGPGRCVVWSTVRRDNPDETLNDVLRDASRRHDNLVVADWALLVASRPELLAFDRVHATPEGYEARAEQTARIVEQCYPRTAASGA